MKVRQISVFLENQSGRLASALAAVGHAGVNIRTLSLADTSDFGVLRLIVDDVDGCVKALKETGHTVSMTEVLAVEVPDRPGGLAAVLNILSVAGLNVEYMYAFTSRIKDSAVVIFRFEESDVAIAALQKAGVSIVAAERVLALSAEESSKEDA
ncbi:MAG: ACT domain-containing protein [Verrucomicrobiota bacterium]|jgi:hypothetical protein|nr:ACT domain-containing protein [Verrucomicrobiota bacterium]